MPTYIEYQLDENSTILIESSDFSDNVAAKTTRNGDNHTYIRAKRSFSIALQDIRMQSKLILKEIEHLHVEEAEVKFGINAIGELGSMVIGKVGVGVNYEVTLRWKPQKRNEQAPKK